MTLYILTAYLAFMDRRANPSYVDAFESMNDARAYVETDEFTRWRAGMKPATWFFTEDGMSALRMDEHRRITHRIDAKALGVSTGEEQKP